jgi:hypothetical protein
MRAYLKAKPHPCHPLPFNFPTGTFVLPPLVLGMEARIFCSSSLDPLLGWVQDSFTGKSHHGSHFNLKMGWRKGAVPVCVGLAHALWVQLSKRGPLLGLANVRRFQTEKHTKKTAEGEMARTVGQRSSASMAHWCRGHRKGRMRKRGWRGSLNSCKVILRNLVLISSSESQTRTGIRMGIRLHS